MLEHEPKVTLPERDLSGCVIPVPLHTAGLGLSARLLKPLVPLYHFILLQWHEGGPCCSTYFIASIRCDGDQRWLPNTCSTINAG